MNDKLRDEVLLRMWNMPPKPQVQLKRERIANGGKQSFRAKPEKWLTAKEKRRKERFEK